MLSEISPLSSPRGSAIGPVLGGGRFLSRREALSKDPVIALVFRKYLGLEKSQGTGITGQSTGVADTGADHSYLTRVLATDVPTAIYDNPGTVSPLFDTSLVNPSGGITTGFSVLTGAVAANNAYQRALATGRVESWLDLVRGVGQSLGGASYLGFRGTSMAATVTGTDTSSAQVGSVLGKATYWLGTIGNIFFGIFYLFLALTSGATLNNLYSLERKMGDNPIEYLQGRLNITEAVVREKFFRNDPSLNSDEAWNEELRREARTVGAQELKALGVEDVDAVLQVLEQEGCLELIGLQIKITQLTEKRIAKLGNLIGLANVNRLAAEGMSPDVEAALVEDIQNAIKINKKIYWTLLVAGVAGVVATVLAFIFTGGIAPLIISGLFLIAIGAMSLTDAYSLKKSVESEAVPGRNDAKVIKGHLALTSMGFAVGIALTIAFGLPFPPLLILGFIAIGVVALDIYALGKIAEKRHHALLERPTMELLREMFDGGEIPEDYENVQEIAHKLNMENVDSLQALHDEVDRYFEQLQEGRNELIEDLKLLSNYTQRD